MSEDSLNTFKEKLNAGGYANIVGARRGIGKFQGMSDADREKARALADKFFAVEGGAPATKTPEKKVVAKKETKAPAKPAPKAAAPKGKAAPTPSPKAPAAAKEAAAKSPVVKSEDDVLAEGIRLADEKNRVIGEFVGNVERVKGSLTDKAFAEIINGVGECLNAVKDDLMRVCGVVVPEAKAPVLAPVITPAPTGGLFASSPK